ncbi:MAG: hypothetical protein MJ070_08710, partial [Lachnospiraceae bacterium]|nr:hypothetical protein [Lachnospiraceae bacterium]
MNKRIGQAVSLLLFAVMLLASLFSCAEKPVPGTDTLPPSASDTVSPETLVTADLPDLDLDGYLISVAHWFLAGWEC